MRGSARICVVRMAQFVLKIEKLSHIIAALESRDTIPAHCASPRKIPEWIVFVREKFPVKKQAYKKNKTNETVLNGFCLFSFLNFTFGFHG